MQTKIVEIFIPDFETEIYLKNKEKIAYDYFSYLTDELNLFVIFEIKDNTVKKPVIFDNSRTALEFINRNKNDFNVYPAVNFNHLQVIFSNVSRFYKEINTKQEAVENSRPQPN